MSKEKIITEVDVPFENVVDLIISAVTAGQIYGCGYWGYADFDRSSPPENTNKLRMQKYIRSDKVLGSDYRENEFWYAYWALFDGQVVFVEHNTDSNDSPAEHKLTRIKIRQGLALMAKKYPEKFGRILAGKDIDGPLGEEFLQICFFGELKYG